MDTNWRMRLRRGLTGIGLLLLIAACGGGDLSLSEYNAQGSTLVAVMEERISTLDAEWDAQTPTMERVKTYWDHRVAARVETLEGLQALDPPEQIEDLLGTGLDLFSKLTAAESALAARVSTFDTVTGPSEWWDTTEGRAVRAVDEEIDAFCFIVQARYDATIERVALAEVPWIPVDMKEVIQIDIGCRK